MPGFYKEGEYDLAGFAVGSVKQDKLIDGSKVGVRLGIVIQLMHVQQVSGVLRTRLCCLEHQGGAVGRMKSVLPTDLTGLP